MILNMHISRDWRMFLEPKNKDGREVAMCGTKTLAKYVGVPGVTNQPDFYSTTGDFGWCITCCDEALQQASHTLKENTSTGLILQQYVRSMDIMARQLASAMSTIGH